MKGQAQQFNWIFVIVAGTIILTFFLFFTFKYMELQEQKQSTNIAKTLEESFQLLIAEELYIDESQFKLGQPTRVETWCTNKKQSIQVNRQAETKIDNAIIFMPQSQVTASFNAWTKSYKAPFTVTNVIYAQPKEQIIEIVYDHTTQQQIQELQIPEVFNIELTTQPTTDNAIHITQQANKRHINLKTNTVTFDNEQIQTDDITLALGALFTGDKETFKCQLQRAQQQKELLIQLYIQKAALLKAQNPTCPYDQIQQNIHNKEKIQEINRNLIDKNCEPVF